MEGVYETLTGRIDELIQASKGPLLTVMGADATTAELATRIGGLERAIREIAREVEELTALR